MLTPDLLLARVRMAMAIMMSEYDGDEPGQPGDRQRADFRERRRDRWAEIEAVLEGKRDVAAIGGLAERRQAWHSEE